MAMCLLPAVSPDPVTLAILQGLKARMKGGKKKNKHSTFLRQSPLPLSAAIIHLKICMKAKERGPLIGVRNVLGGLMLAGAAWVLKPVKPRAEPHTTTRGNTRFLGSVTDAMTPDEIAGVSAAFGAEQAPGQFVRGRHGVTHYLLQSPGNGRGAQTALGAQGKPARLIVMAHGLGTRMQLYDDVVGSLLDAGLTVLRYDYFGHGWSAPDDKYVVYDKQVLLEQLEDVLDHVVSPVSPVAERTEPFRIHGFVGHSTGGCAGVLAANGLESYRFDRLLLISPCFWKDAPLVSNVCGKIPSLVTTILRTGKIDWVAANDYTLAGKIAWMREGSGVGVFSKGAYVYEEAQHKKEEEDARMFRSHPFAAAAIASLDLYILNNKLMPGYRDLMREAVAKGSSVQVLWGEGDQTVPHTPENHDECAAIAETITLPRLGHESIYEAPAAIAEKALAFFA